MKGWLRGMHHVQVQEFRMLLLQATVRGELTAQYNICTWGTDIEDKKYQSWGGSIAV